MGQVGNDRLRNALTVRRCETNNQEAGVFQLLGVAAQTAIFEIFLSLDRQAARPPSKPISTPLTEQRVLISSTKCPKGIGFVAGCDAPTGSGPFGVFRSVRACALRPASDWISEGAADAFLRSWSH